MSTLHQAHERYFNSAFMAPASDEIRAMAFADQDWDDVISSARDAIARVLAPRPSDRDSRFEDHHISLFPNTTGALTRVLAQVQRGFLDSRPTLLTTDLDYPGCVAAINDSWNAPVVMARLAGELIADDHHVDQRLHSAYIRAFNVVKPRVVLVSHVGRTAGELLSAATLTYFREANPRVVIIVDGSQAAGNVVVDGEFLKLCDFYISSGHKWLGGMPTSGFVWHEEPARWQIEDYAQSMARGQQQAGGSGNGAAWLSLAASISEMIGHEPLANLEEHAEKARRLATVFAKRLADVPAARRLTPWTDDGVPSGIVTLTFPKESTGFIADALADFQYSTIKREQVRWRGSLAQRLLLHWDQGYPVLSNADEYTETWAEQAYRFCFHYWHTESDVARLADAIRGCIEMTPERAGPN
jgi:selenocysteine lyase/cysteine desulfurase